MINTPSTLVYVKLQKYRNTKKHAHEKCPQHPGVRETAPSLGSCLGNRLPAWVSIRVSLVSSPFILFSLLSFKIVTISLSNRPFWLLVRSIYDSFKYQGLVILLLPVLKMLKTFFSGIFSIFHLHRPDQRHDLLPIYPCTLVVLRCKHLCLGPVCLAHR